MGFERNGDLVRASSFAPLFGNPRYSPWAYNLVNFNASASYTLPSYAMQRMFHVALADGGGGPGGVHSLGVDVQNVTKAVASASRWAPAAGGQLESFLTLKAVNYGNTSLTAAVTLRGFGGGVSVDPAANATVLGGGDPQGCNSLSAPDAVAPATSALAIEESFDLALEPWSLTFVRIRLVKAAAATV